LRLSRPASGAALRDSDLAGRPGARAAGGPAADGGAVRRRRPPQSASRGGGSGPHRFGSLLSRPDLHGVFVTSETGMSNAAPGSTSFTMRMSFTSSFSFRMIVVGN